LEVAKARIDEIGRRYRVNTFVPVGLGEPLLYPHLIEVLEYARKALPWAKLTLNTNGTRDMRPLIGKLDVLTVSFCFLGKRKHDKRCGVPSYRTVEKNTMEMLHMKGDHFGEHYRGIVTSSGFVPGGWRAGLPKVVLHIFDTEGFVRWAWFYAQWHGHMRKGDYCIRYPYLPLVGVPCPKEGQQDNLMVDVDGNIYDSCMGVWYPPEETKHLLVGRLLA
jgi:hypothetical protein